MRARQLRFDAFVVRAKHLDVTHIGRLVAFDHAYLSDVGRLAAVRHGADRVEVWLEAIPESVRLWPRDKVWVERLPRS